MLAPTMKAMRQGVIASLEAEKKKRGVEGTDASAIEAIEPKLLKIGPVSLAPSTEEGKSSGLTFHYSPYAVGSYADVVPHDEIVIGIAGSSADTNSRDSITREDIPFIDRISSDGVARRFNENSVVSV